MGVMVHEEWLEPISAAADGELAGREQAELDAHLAHCTDCTDLLRTFERDRRRLLLQPQQAPAGLTDSVLAGRARPIGGNTGSTAGRTLVRRGGLALGAVAAAIIAVVIVGRPAPEPTAPRPALAHDHALIDAGSHTFDRAELEVAKGTTVEWRNAGATTHHLVRSLGGATVTEDLRPGQTETATFSRPGTYRFFCTIHPDMTGAVTVDA